MEERELISLIRTGVELNLGELMKIIGGNSDSKSRSPFCHVINYEALKQITAWGVK